MTPYYEHEGITIYHGDCRDVLPQLPPVDLVLTDPPFSERTHRGARTSREGGRQLIEFSAMSVEDIREVFERCAGRLSGWLVSFCDWRYVATLESAPPPGLRFMRFGVWVKPNSAPQLSGDRPAMGWEAIAMLHSSRSPPQWNGGGHRAVWTYLREQHPIHPAQKPLPLVKHLAALFAVRGATILDPFMGSGTVLRAAKDVGCRAIGIELEKRYCEFAANRLAQEVFSFE